jgi:hypothetical protein
MSTNSSAPTLSAICAKAREVQGLGVGGETGHDHLRLVLDGQALDFVVVDQAGVGVDAVLHGVVQLARGRHFGAVGQVTAVGQAHAEDGVAGCSSARYTALLAETGAAGRWRNRRRTAAWRGRWPGLDLVHVLAATVVALARIAFGVFVGQAAALGFHHALAGVVLRRDQLDVIFLALLSAFIAASSASS